jgi:hypothetical protein
MFQCIIVYEREKERIVKLLNLCKQKSNSDGKYICIGFEKQMGKKKLYNF